MKNFDVMDWLRLALGVAIAWMIFGAFTSPKAPTIEERISALEREVAALHAQSRQSVLNALPSKPVEPAIVYP